MISHNKTEFDKLVALSSRVNRRLGTLGKVERRSVFCGTADNEHIQDNSELSSMAAIRCVVW